MDGPAARSIDTTNEFSGIRAWVAQDLSEADDPAALATFVLGAKNLSLSDDNITGSASKLSLDGVLLDTLDSPQRFLNPLAERPIEDEIANTISREFDVDIYAPRSGIDFAEEQGNFVGNFKQSLDTALANNEQLFVASGGPIIRTAQVFSEWLNEGSDAEKAEKVAWALKGSFKQATHAKGEGFSPNGDGRLDTIDDLGIIQNSAKTAFSFFNVSDRNSNRVVVDEFEKAFEDAEDLADELGVTVANPTDAFLVVAEDQNSNPGVFSNNRPNDRVADDIQDPIARRFALENKGGQDISDVGLLGFLKEQPETGPLNQLTRADLRAITTSLDPATPPQPQPQSQSQSEDGATGDLADSFDIDLIDTTTDQTVARLQDGGRISVDDLPTLGSIVLTPKDNAPDFDSITLTFDGVSRTESVEPFALFGDVNGDFQGGTLFDIGRNEIDVDLIKDGDVIESSTIDVEVV